jgi:tetraacyldisaccharide-1-P 4'-kinase
MGRLYNGCIAVVIVGAVVVGGAIKESHVKKIVNALVAAAGSRAKSIIRKQAEAGKPFQENFRSNAGGWN